MRKQYKRILAAVTATAMVWNLCPILPQVLAGTAREYVVDDVEELPLEVLYQTMDYGTKKKDLNLPEQLRILVREADPEEDGELETVPTASTATPSEAALSVATPSGADDVGNGTEDEKAAWKEVRVDWTVNEVLSEEPEYDGETPGSYLFEAEFKSGRYKLGEGVLPSIEVEVLPRDDAKVTAWTYVDPEEYLVKTETGYELALPGASAENPARAEDITALLPLDITAAIGHGRAATGSNADSEELLSLTGWSCEAYPEEGAYEGSYAFTAELPEGYALAEGADALEVKVILGGGMMLAAGVTYLDENGQQQTAATCSVVETGSTTWTNGWYYVNSNVTVSGRITTTGDVHLILGDGMALTASQGITVSEGNSLTIYAQSVKKNTMGVLEATGQSGGAGIGGAYRGNGGTITINGGSVTATGGVNSSKSYAAAGIGGGSYGNGGTITITGGEVTATGGTPNYASGAGIGGGGGDSRNVNGGIIRIEGGTVLATGGSGGNVGAGIGGGGRWAEVGGASGEITITGGNVTAISGSWEDNVRTFSSAGIGGGCGNSVGGMAEKIEITGGIVNADGKSVGVGIGGGSAYNRDYNKEFKGGNVGNITIRGDAVVNAVGILGIGSGIGTAGYYGDYKCLPNADEKGILTIEDETNLGSTSSLACDEYYILTSELTADAIIVPEGLTFTGQDQTEAVKKAISLSGSQTIKGKNFHLSVNLEDWEMSLEPAQVLDIGTYMVQYTNRADGTVIKKEFAVGQATATVQIGEDITYYAVLADALNYANEKTATVTLGADCGLTEEITLTGGTVTLDLAGHVLKKTNISQAMITLTGGNLTIEDSSTTGSGTISANNATVATLWVTGGTLTINGGTISQTGSNSSCQAIAVNPGSLIINGGTVSNTAGSRKAISFTEGSLTINGGIFKGTVRMGNLLADSAVSLSGGTYDKILYDGIGTYTAASFLAENYYYKYAESGHWVPDSEITAQVPTSSSDPVTVAYRCPHPEGYTVDGFCSVCGSYEPATWKEAEETYEISNTGQFYWFAALVNGDDTNAEFDAQNTAANGVLTADIDLQAGFADEEGLHEWTPIGGIVVSLFERPGYRGIFDGGGHTITGLYINRMDDYLGLFSHIEGDSVVKNIMLTDSMVKGKDYIGSVAGAMVDNSRLSNCSNTGTVSADSVGFAVAGGIVGRESMGRESGNTIVSNCFYSGEMTGARVAGIVGEVQNGTVRDSYFMTEKANNGVVFTGSTATITNVRKITEEQLASGEVAWLLQNGQDTQDVQVWGQNLEEAAADRFPVLSSEPGDKVVKVTVKLAEDDTELAACYTNDNRPLASYPSDSEKTYLFYEDLACSKVIPADYKYSGDTTIYAAVETVISVDIEWGAMDFTYNEGEWNPESHTYGNGAWTIKNEDDSKIRVINNSNEAVSISWKFDSSAKGAEVVNGLAGSFVFDNESTESMGSEAVRTLETGSEGCARLVLTGTPDRGRTFDGLEIGSVTVTVGSTS